MEAPGATRARASARRPPHARGRAGKLPHLTVFLIAAALAGCCMRSLGPGLLTGFDFVSTAPQENTTLLSTPVLLVADTHAHHLYGEPLFVTTNLADKLSTTAIRPPQSDLYGQDSFAWMLDVAQKRTPLLHLGDTADASCVDEFEAFLRVMNRAPDPPPWFVAPGNHDGYFYGNSSEDPRGGSWTAACADGSKPMTKADFLDLYLDALAKQTDPGARQLADVRSAHADEASHEMIATPAPGALFLGAAWTIRRRAPWRSYLVQRLDLTRRTSPADSGPNVPKRRVIALLLDTSSYDRKPEIIPLPPARNAGLTGSLGPVEPAADDPTYVPQEDVVRRWADDAKKENAILVLAGHHDFASLESRAQRFLQEIHRRDDAAIYLSAHRHDGHWASIGAEGDAWPELNVGSMLDHPIEMREFSFRWTDSGRLAAVAPLLRLGVDPHLPVSQCDVHQQEWEPAPTDADYAISYKRTGFYAPGSTRDDILKVLLGSYRRLFGALAFSAGPAWPQGLPSDRAPLLQRIDTALTSSDEEARVDLLKRLALAERGASFHDPSALAAFRVCQVYWAARYESRGVRLPDTGDWTILYPAAK